MKQFDLTAEQAELAMAWYKPLLKQWREVRSGPKPTASEFIAAQALNEPRHAPSVETLFIAMCLRDGGSTVNEHRNAGNCGAAKNKLDKVTRKFGKRVKMAVMPGDGKYERYGITLNARGEKAVADFIAAASEPTEPKAKVKAKGKAKRTGKARKAAETVITVNEPAVTDHSTAEPVTDSPVAE